MKIDRIKIEQLFGLISNDYDIQCYPKAYTTIIFSLNGCGKTTLMRLVDAALSLKYTVLDGILFKSLEIHFDNGESLIVNRTPGKNGAIKSFDNTSISELPKDKKGQYYMPIVYTWVNAKGKEFIGKFYLSEACSEKITKELTTQPDTNLPFFVNEQTKKQVPLSLFYTELYTDTEKGLGKRKKPENKEDRKIYYEVNLLNAQKGKIQPDTDSDTVIAKLNNVRSNLILANRDFNRIGAGQITRHKKQEANSFEMYDLGKLQFDFKEIQQMIRDGVIATKEATTSTLTEFMYGTLPSEEKKKGEVFYHIPIPDKTDAACVEIKELLQQGKKMGELKKFISILNERFGFTDKVIQLDKYRGLKAVFDDTFPNAPELSISQLSAGEKNLILLFYELMFKTTKESSIALIDEPEASLHIDWQRALVETVREICEKNEIQALITTHLPSVVNNNFLLMSEMGRSEV